jgi:hypothetical protein
VSVDTYARKSNLRAYSKVRDHGVELLVSKVLAARAVALLIEEKSFLRFRWLAVRAQLAGHHT